MASGQECCETHSPHPDAINKVREEMCDKKTISELAQTFSLLGDPVRVGILHALSIENLCVCDISELLGMSHSAVSHQLRLLRTAKMVKYEKIGRKALYSLDDEHVETLIKKAIEHAGHR
ncbi:ArsR/SmtB family transcription factor [Maridesulfovibrio bastinii]|jgi:DNA-binding transcriptional ArsR family regulator|uniref:ArsR/SmtB family transcription factor n=1 Tax=Maridesulfovibrio bastinii TaxID=47157 RepID=UPI00041502E8|nr:metalloregulator ArsR/SmtB family transcription factor [Maridesulfovibrio bastinii]